MEAITRRRVLAGGLATAAVGITGGSALAVRNIHGTRRFLHRHGVLDGPDRAFPTINPTVEYGTLPPPFGSVNYGLYLPTGTVAAVLYCLHGRAGSRRDAFDGGETFWHKRKDGSNTQRDLIEGGVRAGFHEDASWRSYLPDQLDFIGQHLG